MALDVASLTLDDSQASLASMPEELWRKVTSYLRPATTARAFVVASGSGSLQNALRAEIEQTERAMFGMTRHDAEHVLASRPPTPRQTSPKVGLRHMRGTLCKSILNDPKHRVSPKTIQRPRT